MNINIEGDTYTKDALLFGFVIAVSAGDILTTVIGITNGVTEKNPVAVAAINTVGLVPGLVFLKTAALAVVGIGWVVLLRSPGLQLGPVSASPRTTGRTAVAIYAGITGLVVVANLYVLATRFGWI